MPLQNVRDLVVSSDSLDCSIVEVSTVGGDPTHLALQDGGFVVDGESEGLVAASFRLGDPTDQRTGFSRLVSEIVDPRVHPGLTERQLGRCAQDGIPVRFLLELDHENCTATVTVRILLRPAGFITLTDDKKDLWKRTIRRAWSEECKLVKTSGRAPCREYLIVVDVKWLDDDPAQNLADQTVEVRKGSWFTRARMRTWYLKNRNIRVAHEFGHMLGNEDEYDGTCDGCPERPIFEHSIMSDERQWPHPWPRHYWLIERAVEEMTCSEFDTVQVAPRDVVEGGGLTWSGFKDFWIDAGCEALLPFDPHRKIVT